jgi:hypothetical protein
MYNSPYFVMVFDIILALSAFASQFITAYLGWRVTMDGVRQSRKKLYESLFIIGGAIGAISIALATYRVTGIAHDLDELKAGQRTANRGIAQIEQHTAQPPIINVPAVRSTSAPRISTGFLQLGPVQFLQPQLAPDSPLSMNVYLTNKGQEPIADVRWYAEVALRESKESPISIHSNFLAKANAEYQKQLRSKLPGTTVGVGEAVWATLGSQNITREQADKLKGDSLRFYVFAWARWKNEVGDLDQCVWLKIPEDNNLSQADKLVWRDCIQPSLVPH